MFLLQISPCSSLIWCSCRSWASHLARSPAAAAAPGCHTHSDPRNSKSTETTSSSSHPLRGWNKVVRQCCTAVSRYQSVRPVGAPTANIPATSRDKTRKKNRQVVKSIIDSPWGVFSFSLLGARHGRHGVVGGEGEELCGRSLCARYCPDTGTSSRQHGCLHHDWKRRDEGKRSGREGGRLVRLFDFTRSFPSLCWCSQLPQVGFSKCRTQNVFVLVRQKLDAGNTWKVLHACYPKAIR